jgi:hypothetical protein
MQKNALCRPKRSAQRPGPKPGHAPLVYRIRGYLWQRCKKSDSALVCGVVEHLVALGWGRRRSILRGLAQLRAWQDCGLRFMVYWDYRTKGWAVACCLTEDWKAKRVYLSHRDSRGRPKRWRPTCRAAEWTEEELLHWCGRATPLTLAEIEARKKLLRQDEADGQDSDNSYIETGFQRKPTQDEADARPKGCSQGEVRRKRKSRNRWEAHRRVISRLARGFRRSCQDDPRWPETEAMLCGLGLETVANQVAVSAVCGGWKFEQIREALRGAAVDLQRAMGTINPPTDKMRFFAAAAWKLLRSGGNGGLTRAERVMGRRLAACAHVTPHWRREANSLNANSGGLSDAEFRSRLICVAEGGTDAVRFLRGRSSHALWERMAAWTPLPYPKGRLARRLVALGGSLDSFIKQEQRLAQFCAQVTGGRSAGELIPNLSAKAAVVTKR